MGHALVITGNPSVVWRFVKIRGLTGSGLTPDGVSVKERREMENPNPTREENGKREKETEKKETRLFIRQALDFTKRPKTALILQALAFKAQAPFS